jgi:hypothetical protein
MLREESMGWNQPEVVERGDKSAWWPWLALPASEEGRAARALRIGLRGRRRSAWSRRKPAHGGGRAAEARCGSLKLRQWPHWPFAQRADVRRITRQHVRCHHRGWDGIRDFCKKAHRSGYSVGPGLSCEWFLHRWVTSMNDICPLFGTSINAYEPLDWREWMASIYLRVPQNSSSPGLFRLGFGHDEFSSSPWSRVFADGNMATSSSSSTN